MIHHSDLGATSSPCHPCHRSYQKKAVFIKSSRLFTSHHHHGYRPGDPILSLVTDLWWRGRYPLQCPARTTMVSRSRTQLRWDPIWHLIDGSLTLKVSYQNSNKMRWKHNLMPWFISRLSAASPRSRCRGLIQSCMNCAAIPPCEYQAGENSCFRATSSPRNLDIVCWQNSVITITITRNHCPAPVSCLMSLTVTVEPVTQAPADLSHHPPSLRDRHRDTALHW